MQPYLNLLQVVHDTGFDVLNQRTGEACRTLPGLQIRFDLRQGFPAVTTKKLAWKAVVGELLGFFRGYTNAANFRALNCRIWDQNANETAAWVSNPNRKGRDDLGRIYGAQWTDWADYRIAESDAERESWVRRGYRQVLAEAGTGRYLMRGGINQLEAALRTLLGNPSDRRIIVSAWRPDEFDRMALPPCHMDYRFVVEPVQGRPAVLHVVMTMRSWDLFLGGPFNIASTALFLAIMARFSGMEAGTATIQAANVHIYHNHFAAVHEQLKRTPLPPPALELGESVQPVAEEADIPGVFARVAPEDCRLVGYVSLDAIKAPMAA